MNESEYIKRCLQLAAQGREKAAPNPMVGAVIVRNGKIIGEGYHTECGFAHAEVEAIQSVADQSLLKDSTMYVSLEPCSHFGKTPPCAKLIIEKEIPRVVIGTLDPFPAVSGNGVRMLQEAGVEVKVGVLEEECRILNKAFFCYLENKRPYIVLKWAQTKDGFIDKIRAKGEKPHPTPISNELTRCHVHKLRSEVQSILVGTNTAINDNPSLTVRFWSGNNPTRLLLDRSLRVPEDSVLFDGNVPTLVFTEKEKENKQNCEYVKIGFDRNPIFEIVEQLYERCIQSLLVEGGSQLLQSFIDNDLWDEIQIEVADVTFGSGVAAPHFDAKPDSVERVCNSEMYHFTRQTSL
jgi:diaminohydroxyphosphoribosylaminopyrimidine deaminase/5-amino-6-(5-phosphoribosylamino)uracil reductase